jgi:hypothetical protein
MAIKEVAVIELTEQQQRELAASGWPPEVANPKTGERFVLIHQEMFERVRGILEEADEIPDVEEMYPLTAEVLDGEDARSQEGE